MPFRSFPACCQSFQHFNLHFLGRFEYSYLDISNQVRNGCGKGVVEEGRPHPFPACQLRRFGYRRTRGSRKSYTSLYLWTSYANDIV